LNFFTTLSEFYRPIFVVITGELPYKDLAFTNKNKVVPKGMQEGNLPETLQKLSKENQAIFELVLKFEPTHRLSAKKWLIELENFQVENLYKSVN